jgi:mono/diheme cytochrome c family protein
MAALVIGATGCDRGVAPQPSGAVLFRQDCSACHSLTGHDSPREQGGDLLRLRIAAGAMREFVAEMPVPRALTGAEVRAISRYLLALENRPVP